MIYSPYFFSDHDNRKIYNYYNREIWCNLVAHWRQRCGFDARYFFVFAKFAIVLIEDQLKLMKRGFLNEESNYWFETID